MLLNVRPQYVGVWNMILCHNPEQNILGGRKSAAPNVIRGPSRGRLSAPLQMCTKPGRIPTTWKISVIISIFVLCQHQRILKNLF